MLNISEIQEYVKPEGSFCYSAISTYKSGLFDLRTGNVVSVLQMGNGFSDEQKIFFKGPVNVSSDKECWEIISKFRGEFLSDIIVELSKANFEAGFEHGRREIQREFKRALGI